MNKELLWWAAEVHYLGAEPIRIMPVLTTDPETFRHGLELTYEGTQWIDVFQTDRAGNRIIKND